jgi:ribulose-phosphate 3-epimerase
MINASVICMNPLAIGDDISFLIENGVSNFHFDIMDGSFVPRFGIYPEIVKYLDAQFTYTSDFHLMVSDPISSIREFSKYSIPAKISYHYTANKSIIPEIHDFINCIGSSVIVAFDLDVPVTEICAFLNFYNVSGINLLSIVPGVLKQTPNPEFVIQKLQTLASLGFTKKLDYVQVDGGVNFQTLKQLVSNGCNDLICGSSTLFKYPANFENSERYPIIQSNISLINSLIKNAKASNTYCRLRN